MIDNKTRNPLEWHQIKKPVLELTCGTFVIELPGDDNDFRSVVRKDGKIIYQIPTFSGAWQIEALKAIGLGSDEAVTAAIIAARLMGYSV